MPDARRLAQQVLELRLSHLNDLVARQRRHETDRARHLEPLAGEPLELRRGHRAPAGAVDHQGGPVTAFGMLFKGTHRRHAPAQRAFSAERSQHLPRHIPPAYLG